MEDIKNEIQETVRDTTAGVGRTIVTEVNMATQEITAVIEAGKTLIAWGLIAIVAVGVIIAGWLGVSTAQIKDFLESKDYLIEVVEQPETIEELELPLE
jgi:PII-like signaling protein